MTRTSPHSSTSASRLRRVLSHPIPRIIAGVFAVALAGGLVQAVGHAHGPTAWRVAGSWFLAAAAAIAGYMAFVALTERRAPRELAPLPSLVEAAAGFAGGGALVAIALGLLAVAGACHIVGAPQWTDALWKGLAFMTFIATLEELIARGIILRLLEGWLGSRAALAISALLFGLAYLPGGQAGPLAILVAVVAGLWLGAAFLATRRLGLSIGLHLGWNWTLGRVFSIPVSGHEAEPGAIACRLAGPDWLTGGAYGLEGSAVTLVLLAVATIALLRTAKRRGHLVAFTGAPRGTAVALPA